ncbi:MAG: hypothetical protein PHV34_23105 [Verrucomicrobiae bacterium]|nr:hypothetical protein [Verrucomicrobiae bacterium]
MQQIGIVIALPTEWRYFRRAFIVHHERQLGGHRHYAGRFGDIPVAVIIGGVGKKNALAGALALCEHHSLSMLMTLGYAGALNSELKRGDIVLSSYSRNETVMQPSADDLSLADQLKAVADESHEHHVYVSPLYTANSIVARHEDKVDIYRRTGMSIVDMESYSVYSLAREKGIPFMGIHAVTDTAEEDIPALEIITPFLMSNSLWRYPRIFFELLTHPHYIFDLIPLNHDAQVAGERLAHFMIRNRGNVHHLLGQIRAMAQKASREASQELRKTGNLID